MSTTNFNYNDKVAFTFFQPMKGAQLLEMVHKKASTAHRYTTFVAGPDDNTVRCVHDTVKDAVIAYKKTSKYNTHYIIKGDVRHPFNEYKIKYYDATIKFTQGDFIEEVKRQGTLVDKSTGDIVFAHSIEEILIPKENYTGNCTVLEIINDRGNCIFKILVCERLPIDKEN